MTQEQRIEEAHGLWELSIVRVAAFAEVGMYKAMEAAIIEERKAFAHWQEVSRKILEQE